VGVFAAATLAAPSVIFIDELQAVFGVAGSSTGAPHEHRLLQTLRRCLDTNRARCVSGFLPVVVVGATNVPWLLDPSLLRAGRFTRTVHVGPPSPAEARTIASQRLAECCGAREPWKAGSVARWLLDSALPAWAASGRPTGADIVGAIQLAHMRLLAAASEHRGGTTAGAPTLLALYQSAPAAAAQAVVEQALRRVRPSMDVESLARIEAFLDAQTRYA